MNGSIPFNRRSVLIIFPAKKCVQHGPYWCMVPDLAIIINCHPLLYTLECLDQLVYLLLQHSTSVFVQNPMHCGAAGSTAHALAGRAWAGETERREAVDAAADAWPIGCEGQPQS